MEILTFIQTQPVFLAIMKDNLIVSSKGQITLPAAMRKALGLTGNAIVTAEQQGGRIVLTPAIVVETEIFDEGDIEAWNRDDDFRTGERDAITRRVTGGKRARGAG